MELAPNSYGKIEGNDGNLITGKITVIGVNSDGTYQVRDNRGVLHNNIVLPSTIKPPVVKK